MKKILAVLLCLLLCLSAAGAEDIPLPEELPEETADHGKIVSVEFAEFGGMENERVSLTLASGKKLYENILTVEDGEKTEAYTVSWQAMNDLTEYIEKLQPETWADMPESEIFALDAPVKGIWVQYEDGEILSLTNSKEGAGKIIRNVRCFLESYLKEDKETVTMTFSSFVGGGPEYSPVLSDPEMVEWNSWRRYENDHDPMETGAGYDVILEFTGRIPGTTEMYIEMSGPLMPVPVEEYGPDIYILTVDEDYNVTLTEKE